MTVRTRMLNSLRNGNTFSVAQARSRFGAHNIAARIHELRNEGHVIYSNVKTRADGRRVTEYRLGTPRLAAIRAAEQMGVRLYA